MGHVFVIILGIFAFFSDLAKADVKLNPTQPVQKGIPSVPDYRCPDGTAPKEHPCPPVEALVPVVSCEVDPASSDTIFGIPVITHFIPTCVCRAFESEEENNPYPSATVGCEVLDERNSLPESKCTYYPELVRHPESTFPCFFAERESSCWHNCNQAPSYVEWCRGVCATKEIAPEPKGASLRCCGANAGATPSSVEIALP